MSDAPMISFLAPGATRLAAPLRGGVLESAFYLVEEGGERFLVEAGPAAGSAAAIRALMELVRPRELAAAFLLDGEAAVVGGLIALRNAGFSGPVAADWRAAQAAADAGLAGPFRYLSKEAERLDFAGGASFEVRALPGRPGSVCVAHRGSGCVFSGRLLSALGRDIDSADAEGLARARAVYAETFLAAPALSEEDERLLSCFEPRPLLLCPRYGPPAPPPSDGTAGGGGRSAGSCPGRDEAEAAAGAAEAARASLEALEREVARLRSDNFDLRSAMVGARDQALLDGLTGLYDRAYAEVFLASLSGLEEAFWAAFVQIDRMAALNREAGPEGGDRLIADVGAFLLEGAGESILFRWSGPVFLLVGRGDRQAAWRTAEAMRAAVEAERRFARTITVSVALVHGEELAAAAGGSGSPAAEGRGRGGPVARIQELARTRLKLLARRGGNGVLAESPEEASERATVLVLDGDPVAAGYLAEHLRARGFAAQSAGDGVEGLELMARYEPELVVAEAFLPRLDALGLRARMLEDPERRRVPFVLVCSRKSDALVERAQGLGIYHILEKPLPLRELAGLATYLTSRNGDGS